MNFNELLSKMRQLENADPVPSKDTSVDECGHDMMPPMSPPAPTTQPPNLNISLNAQGMDDITAIMQLIAKVNPDVQGPPMDTNMHLITKINPDVQHSPDKLSVPPLKPAPDITSIKPSEPPKKMLPDLDKSEPLDKINLNKDDKKEWANTPDGTNPDSEVKDISAAVPNGNDLNREKTMYKHSYKQGDNPMSMTAENLRQFIRADLQRRLNESKSKK